MIKYTTTHGYIQIVDGDKRYYEHRAVWEEVNGKIPAGCHIHHIDGNKSNNCLSNLQMMEGREHNRQAKLNTKQSPQTKQRKRETKDSHGNTKSLPIMCVETGVCYSSAQEAANSIATILSIETNRQNICNSLQKNSQKKAYGFTWEYI